MNRILFLLIPLALTFGGSAAQAVLLGPLGGSGLSGEYAQSSDSPFAALDFSGGYFHLEDFEDGLQNTPGVSGNNGGVTSVVFGPAIHDSVDLDDGSLDGSGLAGDSWFFASGGTGVTWTFNAGVLGALTTHAGIVWTDGGNPQTFEAFDAGGASLGTVAGSHATAGNSGQTDSDRFYGVIDLGGISAIKLSNLGGGIELDHLQYGNAGVANDVLEPGTLTLFGIGLMGLGVMRRRHKAA